MAAFIAQASTKAAAGGNASFIIKTSAGMAAGTSAKATINISEEPAQPRFDPLQLVVEDKAAPFGTD